MSVFSDHFARLADFVDHHSEYVLWVATSMGQAATTALPIETELSMTDLNRFMKAMGLESTEWSRKPAMFPQVNVVIREGKVAEFRCALSSLSLDGRTIGFRESGKGFFSIDFGYPNLYLRDTPPVFQGVATTYEALGLSHVKIEDKSGANAYHIPQGSLVVYDPSNREPKTGRPQVSTLELAPTILRELGVEVPGYMRQPAAIGKE